MKKLILPIILSICVMHVGKTQDIQPENNDRQWFYPTASLVTGIPMNDFKETIERNTLWGFNFEGMFIPFKNAPFYHPGLQIEGFFHGHRKDTWHGIEITTQGSLLNLNLTNRLRFGGAAKVNPFIEGAFGAKMSSTQTTYEVVDEATFLEAFLLDEEDEVTTSTAKEHYDFAYDISLGIGCVINKVFIVQVKYNFGPQLEFIKKEDTVVENGNISYRPSHSDIQMIVVSVGFSLEGLKPVTQ